MCPWMIINELKSYLLCLLARPAKLIVFYHKRWDCCHYKLFILFSRNTGLVLTKFGIKHPLVKGIEGPCIIPRGDNTIAKTHWRNLKIFFSRTTRPVSIKLGTKHLWVKGIHACLNKGSYPFSKGDNNEIEKILDEIWKIFFYRIPGSI